MFGKSNQQRLLKRLALGVVSLILALSTLPLALADNSTPAMPAAAVAPVATDSEVKTSEAPPKLLLKPGQPIVSGMQTEDIVVTDDVNLAKEQVAAYPESPEASFILAVCLTRTSMVEQALKEVRRARKLADKQGGPAYFDHMISMYEDMLKTYPDDNRVRYGLAWAYYMKAYVLTKFCRKPELKTDGKQAQALVSPAVPQAATAPVVSANKDAVSADAAKAPADVNTQPQNIASGPWQNKWIPSLLTDQSDPASQVLRASQGAAGKSGVEVDHIPSALDSVVPEAVPQIRKYYESAIKNLDDSLARNPKDVWTLVYRAFLNAEYTGNLGDSMKVWRHCTETYPDNPAPYFFLGEGYLKQGNLKESLQNVSRAIALRALGK